MKKKLILVFCLIVCFGFFISDIKAICYEITNKSNNKVRYDIEYDPRWMNDSNYSIKTVDNEKCGLKSVNKDTTSSTNKSDKNKVTCGKLGKFHKKIPELTSWMISIIQVFVPVILVIMGSIDFVKSLASQKDDEMKKGQQTFIKRLIAGALVFFIIAIVKLIISFAAGDKNKSIINCANCFLNGANDCKVKN